MAGEFLAQPPVTPQRGTRTLNVSRMMGEDLNRSRITGRGLPRAQTQFIKPRSIPPSPQREKKQAHIQSVIHAAASKYVATPSMVPQKPQATESGAKPATPPRFDPLGHQVGFQSEIKPPGPTILPFQSVEHKHATPQFESVGAGDYSGGGDKTFHADDPMMRSEAQQSEAEASDAPTQKSEARRSYRSDVNPTEDDKGHETGSGTQTQPGFVSAGDHRRRRRPYPDPDDSDPSSSGGRGGGRGFRGFRRGPIRSPRKLLRRMLRRREQRQQQPPVVYTQQPAMIHTQQPAIIPVIPHGVGPQRGTENPAINIKITNKAQAIINEKKKRRGVTKGRKTYSKLRRDTIKAIRKGRADHYRVESKKLTSLPVKKRKAARDKLKKRLREREVRLVGQLPTASKMSLKDLDRLSQLARKLKW